jgi:hypothetical protein
MPRSEKAFNAPRCGRRALNLAAAIEWYSLLDARKSEQRRAFFLFFGVVETMILGNRMF